MDDHPLLLRVVADYLREFCAGEVTVQGTASDGEEALALARYLRPDVILLDLNIPALPGLEVIPRLRVILPEAGIIVMTLHGLAPYRQAALAACANEFVDKTALSAELLPAIRRVADPRASQSPRDRPESAGTLPVHRGVDQTGGEHK
ncbi:MAG: response regulator transcription factor [Chloroflexi bacterium]|nr:response regulator transcription factor [Chloroflexota bacterium]